MDNFEFQSLANKDINQLSYREAMGLPNRYVACRFESMSDCIPELLKKDTNVLADIVEAIDRDLPERLAAGQLLALIGDHRIDVYSPHMISIPSGVLKMGTNESEAEKVAIAFGDRGVKKEWILKECPSHDVQVATFKIAKYPVTNIEYREYLLDSGASDFPTSWNFGVYPQTLSNHPVYTVTVDAAKNYCEWLSKKTNRRFRLPTEAEWEFAARGETLNEYPWGNDLEASEIKANTLEAGVFQTTAVGSFPRGNSVFAVSDMAGNVEEYTMSLCLPYPNGKAIQDDLVETIGLHHVARGGSFARFMDLARCARRHGAYPSPLYAIGFRLVEDVSVGHPKPK